MRKLIVSLLLMLTVLPASAQSASTPDAGWLKVQQLKSGVTLHIKTTTGKVMVGLETPTSGNLFFEGEDLHSLRGDKRRYARRNIQMMFQDPYSSLNPRQRVGSILADKNCSRCHDSESSPERVSNYDNLEVKPHPFTEGSTLNKMSDADLTSIILHGGPALNRSALMPPYGNTLSAADVKALIAYVRAVADPPYQPAGTVYARK